MRPVISKRPRRPCFSDRAILPGGDPGSVLVVRGDHFAWWRVVGWLRKRHHGLNWGTLSRRYLPRWEIRDGTTEMFRPRRVAVTHYRYRGTRIPTP